MVWPQEISPQKMDDVHRRLKKIEPESCAQGGPASFWLAGGVDQVDQVGQVHRHPSDLIFFVPTMRDFMGLNMEKFQAPGRFGG